MTLIVVDFDETITEHDTISLISQIPYTTDPTKTPPFEYFTNVYLQALEKYRSVANIPKSMAEEIEYQKGMKSVEMSSINELERHQLFNGITKQSLAEQAVKVKVKPGFSKFLSICSSRQIPVKILSVNWSSVLIRGVLAGLGYELDVMVNELQFDGHSVCTGHFDPTISVRTGYDKYMAIEQLKRQYHNQKLIYIGDSRTDLLALLASDMGVIMESGSLIQKLPWDIDVRQLSGGSDIHGLYTSNWYHINEFLELNTI
ncbi:hypothetical protein PSN45_001367 [Yamadazyma tenuis]|uniref:HAD-like protein n=1 Tax=Candida tenuis (strain ATCC 10573 / BCRC 21748 / CBS 615 / JCM 9827 / NBRC 10315 / NRRL Y-1498 / VKM Y-70) TaxID=590646 RepID=G3BCN7_CANTC|nr:HAD-like protein [Yamadazyma tenuis ATCC 10573]XP_006690493.1 uncharacterized protein CANTEDRAFT_116903 [Yamadazyma tenuis ATCC 10573]EGV61278.1 HAD-like protein [Yamadazyma tenuis ATCC 10573]EGV61279.1 hypothetical protein CANTEDRAFT_116903 [Yamadazyma tenuis ATCC 10573]WEJ93890.1 hypothetical protein PSN45_001367 [Yamadazyma tenuis]